MRIVVLISGGGSNLQSLLDACSQGLISGEIVGVVSNRPHVKGLERATNYGIPSQVLDHQIFDSREAFDRKLCQVIDSYEPDLVVLAGFMRILTPDFVNHYLGRLLNIHPSLLPKYPGLHTHKKALEAGDQWHGATVHFVTAELDGGPAIIQAKVPVQADDTEATLANRVLAQEHLIYPRAVQWFASGALRLVNDKSELNGAVLPVTGVQS